MSQRERIADAELRVVRVPLRSASNDELGRLTANLLIGVRFDFEERDQDSVSGCFGERVSGEDGPHLVGRSQHDGVGLSHPLFERRLERRLDLRTGAAGLEEDVSALDVGLRRAEPERLTNLP